MPGGCEAQQWPAERELNAQGVKQGLQSGGAEGTSYEASRVLSKSLGASLE